MEIQHNQFQPNDNSASSGSGNSKSFQAQLFTWFSIAGFILAIVAAFAYSWMASSMMKQFYEREGVQAAENFARLSELALLYESGDNAKEAALATLNFPSIKHVAIISASNNILLEEGDTDESIISSLAETQWQNDAARIFSANSGTWQIAAPAYTVYEDDSESSLVFGDIPQEKNYLGYVAIQIDTSELKSFQQEIFFRNLIVGLGYGLAFAIVLKLTLTRLLRPMNTLASVMQETTDEDYKQANIDAKASSEIAKIGEVYNQMIANLKERDHKLRGQKDLLETEVTLRTSELVQARDAALDANRHKSEFLANITHELRTPLQSIIGYTEVIGEILEDEGIFNCEQDIEKITRNADHLLELINSVLDISKIEAGRMETQNTHVNIASLIDRTTDTVAPLAKNNGNELIIENELTLQTINLDEKKLFQILLNLLSNAAKFTENGTITLSAKTEANTIYFEVKDTGIGISKEKQKIIFEPFRQIDGSETREFFGTGLGLSIAMQFTHLLNGTITLVSETGKGSCFRVTLPLPLQDQNTIPKTA